MRNPDTDIPSIWETELKDDPALRNAAIEDDNFARNKRELDEIGYKPVSAEEYLNSKGKGKVLAAAQKKDAELAAGTTPPRPGPPIPRPEGPSRPPVDLTNREKLISLQGGEEVNATTQASQAAGSVVDDAAKAAPVLPTDNVFSTERKLLDFMVEGLDEGVARRRLEPHYPLDFDASKSWSPPYYDYTRTYDGGDSVLSDEINSMNSMSEEKMARREVGRLVAQAPTLTPPPTPTPPPPPTPAPTPPAPTPPAGPAPAPVQSASHTLAAGTPVTSTSPNTTVQASQAAGTKAKVGFSEMLASGKVGRNALAGATVGAVLGGLNPAGDDGLFRGAMGGAVVGATMGGLASAANAYMNQDGTDIVSKGGRLFPTEITPTSKGPGKVGMLMSVGGVVGGIMGGLIGGSGKGKRHNTIDSNGWSKGTHPAYF